MKAMLNARETVFQSATSARTNEIFALWEKCERRFDAAGFGRICCFGCVCD